MVVDANDSALGALIGLWQFLHGEENKDTGLDDGIAQDGSFIDGASARFGHLFLDGHNDRFDVHATPEEDNAFDLTDGRIETSFRQFDTNDRLFASVVSRGEFFDSATEGYFGIEVTREGAVQVTHISNGTSVMESTPDGFAPVCDTIHVSYCWSETNGGQFVVQNLTKGTEYTTDTAPGVNLAIGDKDGTAFTFGARENVDESVTQDPNFIKHFDGKIDFVAVYDTSDGAPTTNGSDGFVTHGKHCPPCFTPGTKIATPQGERLVEELQVGDKIITRDNGIQEIRWLGMRALTRAEMLQARHMQPVLIRQGALGYGLPERDMMVSPNHRVLVSNDKTALYFDESEVLAAAKHLTGLEGVEFVELPTVTYIHFMFDQHEVVLSDGAWTESFQPGDQSLAGIGHAQRQEIFELFPELNTTTGMRSYQAARRSLKRHEAFLVVS